MNIIKENFGALPDGANVEKFTVANSNGFSFSVITFGAIMTSFFMPDSDGVARNITLGPDTLEGYLENTPYFGATVGRFANRIAYGKFTLKGREYFLAKNDGEHHLHGGEKGFNKVLWAGEPFEGADSGGVKLSYRSKDGEENYPGNLDVTVTFELNNKNELFFKYTGETDKETPVNLTNHTYWNLRGRGDGTILDHQLRLNCSRYLPRNDLLIPTGELRSVEGAAMDFTKEKLVGDDIQSTEGGYDHCFVINESSMLNEGRLKFAAQLSDPESGRSMLVFTDLPGIQLYTGNSLEKVQVGHGTVYRKHSALCLETENFPDAVNKPEFPNPFLKSGELYKTVTMHRFSVS